MNPLKNKKKVYTLMAGGFVTVSVLLAGISLHEIHAFSSNGDSADSIYGNLRSIIIKDTTEEVGSGSVERTNEENLRDIIDNSSPNVKTTFSNEKDEKSMTSPYGLDNFNDPFESTSNTQSKAPSEVVPNGGKANDIVPEYNNPNQNMTSPENSFIDRGSISPGFLEISLRMSKEEVEDFHDLRITKFDPLDAYAIQYDYTTNIINIVNTLEDVAYRGVYLNNLVDSEEEEGEETTIEFLNEGRTSFKLEYWTDELGNQSTILKATDGYNGHAELLVGGIPVIVSNDPSIEPLGESQPTEDYDPEQETDYTQDEHMQEDYDDTQEYPIFDDEIYPEIEDPYEDYETGRDIWHDTDDFWGDDDIDDFWADDTINPEGSPSPNNPIQDSGDSVDFGADFDTDFDIESGTSTTNKKKPYKAVWGATEGSDHLKSNIKDRDEVLKNVKDRQSLNVVDIRGNSVDLVQKTKDTAPAQFKRELPVAVGESEKNKDHIPFVKLMALLSFLSMIGSIISINLYYKEASREAKLKELDEVDLDLIKAQDFDELVGKDLDIEDILELK